MATPAFVGLCSEIRAEQVRTQRASPDIMLPLIRWPLEGSRPPLWVYHVIRGYGKWMLAATSMFWARSGNAGHSLACHSPAVLNLCQTVLGSINDQHFFSVHVLQSFLPQPLASLLEAKTKVLLDHGPNCGSRP